MSGKDCKIRTAVIAGAGPAGLTAAQELLMAGGYAPVVFEASSAIGGLSQTAMHGGNRIDIGGHRFFSKSARVCRRWDEMMPGQSATTDPGSTDRVMLRRPRVSRIYYLRRFFDYPISLKWRTFANMGLWRTLAAGCGYIAARMHKRPERSLEDFYVNRFGRPLYSMFFEDYTEKVWGLHPSRLGADWGSQRVKGLSVTAIVKDMLAKRLGRGPRRVETSLIEEFSYPKFGPGQLWETVAEDVRARGGQIELNARVSRVHVRGGRVEAVTVTDAGGAERRVGCDVFFSSMPLCDLVAAIEDDAGVPDAVRRIAAGLPYRDFMTVGLLVKGRCSLPDNWIYIQERDVRVGRLQVFNNWSPYMVERPDDTTWLGLEYFCNEGDGLWTMSDDDFISMAVGELAKIGLLKAEDVIDSVRIRMPKAYPAYYGAYYELPKVREYLDGIANLYCIGRNGQHRYNNMDHSMLTAMTAVDTLISGSADKAPIWDVNTESEYHESK